MYQLFDTRGLVLASMWGGNDPDAVRGEDGKRYNSPGHTLERFIDSYLLEALKVSDLRDIIAVFDGGNQYRRAIFPGYKVKPEMDQAQLDAQNAAQAAVVDLLKGLGITMVRCPETEADDVIAFLVERLPGAKMVHTVDHDLLQLASETCLLSVGHNLKEHYHPQSTSCSVAKPIAPRHVALFKSLVGDSSDMYGGVKGFGPKAWDHLVDLVEEDGLDQLVECVSRQDFGPLQEAVLETGDKVLTLMYEKRLDWTLFWKVACLHPEIVEARRGERFHRLQWEKRVPDPERVRRTLTAEGSRRMIPVLEPYLPQHWLLTGDNIGDVGEYLGELEEMFKASPYVSFDLETSDQLRHPPFKQAAKGREYVDMLSSTITGAGFTFGRNSEFTFYSSYDHADTSNLDRSFLLEALKRIPPHVPIIAQNAPFERTLVLNTLGYDIPNLHDTKLMASHVDEESSNGLKDMSKAHLAYDQIKYRDVIEDGKVMSDYSAEHVFRYGADDPICTAALYDLFKLIMLIEGTWEGCEREYFPNVYPISDAYLAGVSTDEEEMARQHAEDQATYERRCAELRALIKANQTSASIEEGAQRVMEELAQVAVPKFLQKLDLTAAGDDDQLAEVVVEDKVREFKELLLEETRAKVTYQDYEERPKEIECKPTLTEINRLLKHFQLPEISIIDPAALVAWRREIAFTELDPDVQELFEAIGALEDKFDAKGTIPVKQRKGDAYTRFATVANRLKVRSKDPSDLIEKLGFEMNFDSPNQMQVLLYGMLNLPVRMRSLKQSKTRIDLDVEDAASQANKDAFAAAMANDCPEGSWQREAMVALMEARECLTRLKMFYRVYPLWVHPKDGQIHPQISICGTETRRPTGSSPNPLQWPKRDEGKKFRRNILPNRNLGHDLVVSIDFDSQELRFGAGLSMDEGILACFVGKDELPAMLPCHRELLGEERAARFLLGETRGIHSTTGAGMMGVTYEEFEAVRHDKTHPRCAEANGFRRSAKAVNFGSMYGIGPPKLSRQLLVPEEEAKAYLSAKKATYPRYEAWCDEVKVEAAKNGYVTTLLGDRRHLHRSILDPEWASSAGRQAVNYKIQGLAAGKLARTLSEIHRRGTFRRHNAVLIAPVYDELVFSCHHSVAPELILEVHAIMVEPIPGMAVPVVACPSLGINFADQIEIGKFPTRETILAAIDEAFGQSAEIPQETPEQAPEVREGRWLLWHPESESIFEEFTVRGMEGAMEQNCNDVTDMPQWEEYFVQVTAYKAAQQEAA
jgi:DNA polymerase I-like protein with 3'-5' exonuclease and polymerase domains